MFTTRFAIALSAPAFAAAAIAAGGGFSGSAAAQPVTPARSAHVGQHSADQYAGTARVAGGHAVTAAQSADLLAAKPAAAASSHRLSRNEEIAWKMMFKRFHWRPKYQFRSLRKLWDRESSWNVHASNPYSGAYGIPQAVPGSKMASAGRNWRNSARTQIRWGLRYIRSRYGTPRRAWAHETSTGWY